MSLESQVRRELETAAAVHQLNNCPVSEDLDVACTLEMVKGGYKVKREHGKGFFSKKPQSKAKAAAQLRVIEMHKHGG